MPSPAQQTRSPAIVTTSAIPPVQNAGVDAATAGTPASVHSENLIVPSGAHVTIELREPHSTGTEAPSNEVWVAVINNVGTILSSAAWPVAVAVAAYFLREQISKILGRLKTIKWGDFEASIDEEIKDRLGDDVEPQTVPQTQTSFTSEDLISRSPIDAIVTAWVSVERAMERFSQAHPVSTSRPVRRTIPPGLTALLPKHETHLLHELRLLRNKVVHEADVSLSEESVRLYVERAFSLAAAIDALTADENNSGSN